MKGVDSGPHMNKYYHSALPMEIPSTSSNMCLWSRNKARTTVKRAPPRATAPSRPVLQAEAVSHHDNIHLAEIPAEDIARLLSCIARESTPTDHGSPTPSSEIFPDKGGAALTGMHGEESPERCHTPGSATPTFGPGTPLCKFSNCFIYASVHIIQTKRQRSWPVTALI
jgi:hypothetical protein